MPATRGQREVGVGRGARRGGSCGDGRRQQGECERLTRRMGHSRRGWGDSQRMQGPVLGRVQPAQRAEAFIVVRLVSTALCDKRRWGATQLSGILSTREQTRWRRRASNRTMRSCGLCDHGTAAGAMEDLAFAGGISCCSSTRAVALRSVQRPREQPTDAHWERQHTLSRSEGTQACLGFGRNSCSGERKARLKQWRHPCVAFMVHARSLDRGRQMIWCGEWRRSSCDIAPRRLPTTLCRCMCRHHAGGKRLTGKQRPPPALGVLWFGGPHGVRP